MAEFGLLNWAILVIYVIANLLLGYVLGKRINTAQDFFLGKKTPPWWAIGISVIATCRASRCGALMACVGPRMNGRSTSPILTGSTRPSGP